MGSRPLFVLTSSALLAGCVLLTDLDGLSKGGPGSPDGAGAGSSSGGEGGEGGGTNGEGGTTTDAEAPPGPPKWRLVSSTGPARHSTTLAYDENRQRMVMFGGWAGAGDLQDTWEWDGATWTQRTLPTDPPSRRGHKMVRDVARKSVFMFGGTREAMPENWSWDGLRWRTVASTEHPPSFQNASMTYDTDRGVVVLFGGHHYPAMGSAVSLDETWEWNGTDWAKRAPTVTPSIRRGHVLAYDAARKRVLMFGGRGGPGGALGDTWEYDGTTWKEREPITFPKPTWGACAAFDPRRNLVVMFGGSNEGTNSAATWLWDGNDWSMGPAGPPALRSCAMAWDPVQRAIVLFSGAGQSDGDGPPSAATWYFE